jgi:hypothetical protein
MTSTSRCSSRNERDGRRCRIAWLLACRFRAGGLENAMITASNDCVQAMPGCACCEFERPGPVARDAERWAWKPVA